MGHRLKISATITSIILLSGMLGFGFSPVAFAEHNDNGKGLAKGCDNGTAKNNPHCNGAGGFTDCDTDGTFGIDKTELVAQIGGNESDAQDLIDAAEALDGGADNGVIDTAGELFWLNSFLSPEDDCF